MLEKSLLAQCIPRSFHATTMYLLAPGVCGGFNVKAEKNNGPISTRIKIVTFFFIIQVFVNND
jgi:hypothetical protein